MFESRRALRFTRAARGMRKDGSQFVGEMSWGIVETEGGPLMLAVAIRTGEESFRGARRIRARERRLRPRGWRLPPGRRERAGERHCPAPDGRAHQYQAVHDPLTGLANRTLCHDRLALAVARSRRSGHRVAVLFIDLDAFKLVNDRFGHAAGDAVLAAFAGRLADEVRPSDTVARFGGDEFLVICEDLDESDALALGRRLADLAHLPIEAAGAVHRLSASIGIAVGGIDAAEPDALVRTADTAAYRAKVRGHGAVELFRP